MARYLIAMVVAVVLAVAWYRLETEEAGVPRGAEIVAPALPAAGSERPPELLDEINVPSARNRSPSRVTAGSARNGTPSNRRPPGPWN